MSEKKPRNVVGDLSRREFFAAASGVTLATLFANTSHAADLPALTETDSIAVSMGYRSDTTKVDGKKYAAHKASQSCSNCRFYQGAAGDKFGGCQIFAGKSVSANGWCQVYAAK